MSWSNVYLTFLFISDWDIHFLFVELYGLFLELWYYPIIRSMLGMYLLLLNNFCFCLLTIYFILQQLYVLMYSLFFICFFLSLLLIPLLNSGICFHLRGFFEARYPESLKPYAKQVILSSESVV